MRVLIVGAGAIGCLVGGKLAEAGVPVTLVGRPAFAATVRRQGLVLTDERGLRQIRAVTTAGSLAEALDQPALKPDLAILTVKSYDTAAALEELGAALRGVPAPAILSLQNGVGNEDAILAFLRSGAVACDAGSCVLAGTITTPVSIQGPGEIRVDRPKYTIGISAWDAAAGVARLDAAAIYAGRIDAAQAALTQAGFAVTRYPDARGMKWTKLLMNMAGNAASAILDMPPDEIFAQSRLVDVEIAAWREALNVMRCAGIPPVNLGGYPFGTLAPWIRRAPRWLLRPVLRSRIGGARGGKLPSLHIDLHAGKSRSEVRWLNGAVVRLGEELGVATPVNRVLTDTVLSLIGAPQAQAAWRRNPDRLLDALAAASGRGGGAN